MPLAVHHLAVVVSDLARAEVFYTGVLGLEPVERWNDDAGRPRSVWLALDGGAFLAVEKGDQAAARRTDAAPGWHCVAFKIAVDERDTWRAVLGAAGHPVERDSRYSIYARDPDGNLIALSHYPDPCAEPVAR